LTLFDSRIQKDAKIFKALKSNGNDFLGQTYAGLKTDTGWTRLGFLYYLR
jgi:hypothetical protein